MMVDNKDNNADNTDNILKLETKITSKGITTLMDGNVLDSRLFTKLDEDLRNRVHGWFKETLVIDKTQRHNSMKIMNAIYRDTGIHLTENQVKDYIYRYTKFKPIDFSAGRWVIRVGNRKKVWGI